MSRAGVQRIPLQLARDCVVASIQIDLDRDVLQQFREDLLQLLHTSGSNSVILDLSGLELMDLEDFEALRGTISMAAVMGAETVIAGLQPGIVSALVELDADVEGLVAAGNLDAAFRLLEEQGSQGQPDSESPEHDADDGEHEADESGD